MSPFFTRWLVTTLAVAVVCSFPGATGIGADSAATLVAAGLLLGILNALVRPALLLLSLPFLIVTLGLFVFLINATLLWMVSRILPGFHVAGFGSAFEGAILISLISWPLNVLFRGKNQPAQVTQVTRVTQVNQTPLSTDTDAEPPMKTVQGRVIK